MVKLFGANLLAAENTAEARRVNVLVLQDSTLRLILPPLSESVSRRFFVFVNLSRTWSRRTSGESICKHMQKLRLMM